MSMSFFKSKTQSNQVLACKNQIFSDINPPPKKMYQKNFPTSAPSFRRSVERVSFVEIKLKHSVGIIDANYMYGY